MRQEAIEFIRERNEKRQAWLCDVDDWKTEQFLKEIIQANALARIEHEESIWVPAEELYDL